MARCRTRDPQTLPQFFGGLRGVSIVGFTERGEAAPGHRGQHGERDGTGQSETVPINGDVTYFLGAADNVIHGHHNHRTGTLSAGETGTSQASHGYVTGNTSLQRGHWSKRRLRASGAAPLVARPENAAGIYDGRRLITLDRRQHRVNTDQASPWTWENRGRKETTPAGLRQHRA